ncbi:MAG TPA: beta-ketoacyl synthase chain length factor [Ferruginibacter sp.]|nr:beta-ketoacyl synthase chain length factor [Ferruginibacter sp.]
MLYIHQAYCISPQKTFQDVDLQELHEPAEKRLLAIEPLYDGIPPGVLRRMGRAVRMGAGASMPIIKNTAELDGIIIGTGKGGMEDCIKFLNQIVQYEEGLLAPGNFVQSTSNAVAAQVGMMSKNRSYNTTHVHRGHAFENALIDAVMQLNEFPGSNYLLGGVDEISDFDYNIENLDGAYKQESISSKDLYQTDTPGSIAGEGAAMFLVNDQAENAIACINAVNMLHSQDLAQLEKLLQQFISTHIPAGEKIDLFLSGESGDNRTLKFYTACESLLPVNTPVARFKHLSGEYATASSFAVWLACYIMQQQKVPGNMMNGPVEVLAPKTILLYNNYKGLQHSFILIRKN